VAICGSEVRRLMPDNRSLAELEIEGIGMTCGVIVTRNPSFDPSAPENRFKVFLKVKGFSCNFRDLNFILAAARKGAGNSFLAIGSDFVGEIVAIGSGVTRFKAGDRVISDNHYTGAGGAANIPEGVLTNQASKEYQIAFETKLTKIPSHMPDKVAAAFSIGAQTVYGMIRRLELKAGATVLVTAAKSNTSLFAINALRRHDVRVYALSTSLRFEEELRAMGVRELIQVDPGMPSILSNECARKLISEIGPFNYVIDPFLDLYLAKVMEVIAPNGKYISCGFYRQFHPPNEAHTADLSQQNLMRVLYPLLANNIQVIGNCIGLSEDLKNALADYEAGLMGVSIDSVFEGDDAKAFFERTYNARDRFGKVVYLYD
jgi:NADPH:quinone reductase-like Zn-dependent oxidoreductase